MKKLLAMLSLVPLAVSLTACSDSAPQTPATDETKPTAAVVTVTSTEPTDTAPETTATAATTAATTTQTAQPRENVFYNPDNTAYDVDKVSVKPCKMYWEGDTLVAECFVINGCDTVVSNINVNELAFANSEGVFASASFGQLTDLSLNPYTNVLWTFRFEADCVDNVGTDLSSVSYYSSTQFDK